MSLNLSLLQGKSENLVRHFFLYQQIDCIFTIILMLRKNCSTKLTRRICLAIKASLLGDHFTVSYDLNVGFWGDMVRRK